MGWWIALGVIFLLGILPLGVSARYSGEGPLLRVVIGPVRLTLFPRKKKEKKPKPAKKTAEQPKKQEEPLPKLPQPPKQEPAADKKEKGGSLLDFLPLVKVALNFLGDFRRRLRVNRLELKLILAGGDPCDLAVNYGRAWAAVWQSDAPAGTAVRDKKTGRGGRVRLYRVRNTGHCAAGSDHYAGKTSGSCHRVRHPGAERIPKTSEKTKRRCYP